MKKNQQLSCPKTNADYEGHIQKLADEKNELWKAN